MAADSDTAAPSAGRKALARAKETGHRVEVTGDRTERSTTYANPDGFSFTLEESAVPVRVKAPGGGWRTPDATLVRHADGSVGPKAAVVDMRLSGGGDSDLVAIRDRGRSLELGWPGTLPKPELSGSSAVYRDVLPDVDLKVTASVEGFRHVLVVKTPAAARNPKLKRFDYGLKATGLDVRRDPGGGLAAVDADGTTVFKAPPAQMWDSSGAAADGGLTATTTEGEGPPSAAGTVRPAAGERLAPRAGVEPLAGDRVAPMAVTLGRGRLSVAPDPAMLSGAGGVTYPLYVDPTVTWGAPERTMLNSKGYSSYNWDNGSDDRGMGMGKCGTWNGYYCGDGFVQRLYFQFSPDSLRGKHVLDATFRVTETWSFSCDAREVDLVRTDDISPSTQWSTKPWENDLLGDRHVSAGRGTACSPSQPVAPIEFHDNHPDEPDENLTETVRGFAVGWFSKLTLELRAHDESDTSAWKRFKNDAVLSVTYVGIPDVPGDVGLVSGNGLVCSTNPASPTVVSDPTVQASGRPRTVWGGESGANLRIQWRVEKWNGSGWQTAFGDTVRPSSGYVGHGVNQTASLPAMSEGVSYRLMALSLSYYEGGSQQLNTGYTPPCYFTVDPSAPEAPTVSVASPYSECRTNACTEAGAPSVPASFSFSPAPGEDDVIAYQYRLSTSASWSAEIPGSPVTVSATPDRAGTFRLYVRAKDRVGRWGAEQVFDVLVAAGAGPVGRWHFQETNGVAADSATGSGVPAFDATLGGGSGTDDRGRRGWMTHDASGAPLATPITDRGLWLNGSTGYAATAGPVIDTRASYTLSAWARILPNASGNRTVVGQDGTHRSAFYLSYMESHKTWTLRTSPNDAADGDLSQQYVLAKEPATPGVWTHLGVVYDAPAGLIKLYVNGKLQGTDTVAPSWAANGPLQIGRAKWGSTHTDYFPGSIDEVAVWQRALTDAEVQEESRLLTSAGFAGAELVADWSAARGSGTTVADTTSGYKRDLTLSGGAYLDDWTVHLDGEDDSATAAGPLVDDTGSFTVTTAVAVNGAKVAEWPVGAAGQVAGQRTADGSSWGIWYQLTGKTQVVDQETLEEKTVPEGVWHFGRRDADGTFSSVTSDAVATVDSEVRLTGVFDAQAGTVALYLGHNRNGLPVPYTARVGTGEFAVGAAYEGGFWRHRLPCRVADVRVWAGAMASVEQIAVRVGS
ncbi:LamG domain-containing protein [Streptomyces sp. NPDC058872]|uniref:LamG domain-containing protein n=1 Tax=Streptomyces sp. NPDC058872 TaxID=3346661 RepID=UPI003694C7A1